MARMLSRALAMSAIIEPGTPETTAFGSGIHLFRNLTPWDVDTTFVDLQPITTSFTNPGGSIGRQLQAVRPGFTLQGYPAGGRADYRFGRIFRMCGLAETLSGDGTTATYKFRSGNFETGAMSFYEGSVTGNGVLYRATQVSGNLRFAASAGQQITVDMDGKGLYQIPITQAAPTTTYPANNVNTFKGEGMTITPVGGSALTSIVGKSWNLDLGWPINEDLDFNAANAVGGLIVGKRAARSQIVIAQDSTDILTLYADLTANTHLDVVFTHTDADGGKIKFTYRMQLTTLPKGDDNDRRTVTLDGILVHSTDDSELQIDVYR